MNIIHPKYYLNKAKELYKFSIAPTFGVRNDLSISEKIKGTWGIFAVKMALTIIIGVCASVFDMPANQTTARHSETFSPLHLVVVGVLILPFLEEVAFRLSLKFKSEFLAFTSSTLTYYFLSKAIYHTNLSNTEVYFKERVLASLAVLVVSFAFYSWPVINKMLMQFWETNFRWVLYTMCFGFAAMHLFNYEISTTTMIFIPLLLLPKLISALSYSYIRANYGFIYAIALHFMWNSIGVTISLIPGGD